MNSDWALEFVLTHTVFFYLGAGQPDADVVGRISQLKVGDFN